MGERLGGRISKCQLQVGNWFDCKFLPPLPNILNKLNTPSMDTVPLESETEFMGWKVPQELSNNPPSDILSSSRESF